MSPPRHRWFAATYDFFMRREFDRLKEIRQFAAGEASGRILEVGCGTGLNLNYYDWSRVESLELTEPDTHMLKRAREKVDALSTDIQQRIQLKEAPAEALPYPDASFDAIVCTLVLCTVEDPQRALAEMHRVLRPGGTLRVVEHVRGEERLARVQRFIQPVWGWTAAGCHLDRQTEATIAASGFELDVAEHFKMGPLLPAFRGVATSI